MSPSQICSPTPGPMLLTVAFIVPKIVAIVFILHIIEFDGLQDTTAVFLDIFFICTLLLLPGVLATLTSGEVDRIKILILRQYLMYKGDPTNPDLIEAIQDSLLYIEQRPFKFTVWRLFAVDMTMVVTVISLATTCSLIMIQFGHFYG